MNLTSTEPEPGPPAPPLVPATPAPTPAQTVSAVLVPLNPGEDIPPGWELSTQTIRRIKAPAGAAAASSSIKPTGVVVGAAAGATFAPMVLYMCNALGHPLPPDAALALPALFAFLGGWLHPAGRK